MLSDSEKLERLFELYEKKMYATAFQILQDVRSAAIDIYRKNQREWENVFYDPEDVFKNQQMSNDRGMDTVEDRHVIQRALLALDTKYREVLELKCYFGLSHREIAMLLEVSEDTVAKRYERAKRIAIKMIGDGACA